MRVMTYNMLHAPGDRLDDLFEVIRDAQPDVLACQEIDDIPGLLEIARRLEMPAVIGHANRPESPPAPEHLALLTRWPIVSLCVSRGDTEAMFRPVLEVWVVPPESEPVGFFVVHFRASPGVPGSHLKLREVRHLCGLLERASGRYCALGDFNAWAPGEGDQSPEWHADLPEEHRAALRGGVIGQIQALALDDTWRHCHPAPQPSLATLRGNALSRVDYIWASADLAALVTESSILRSPRAEIASDHYPVLTVFGP
jgi:endonuclease/exonuclease/phosphatase family metal-dependent hydrolase